MGSLQWSNRKLDRCSTTSITCAICRSIQSTTALVTLLEYLPIIPSQPSCFIQATVPILSLWIVLQTYLSNLGRLESRVKPLKTPQDCLCVAASPSLSSSRYEALPQSQGSSRLNPLSYQRLGDLSPRRKQSSFVDRSCAMYVQYTL